MEGSRKGNLVLFAPEDFHLLSFLQNWQQKEFGQGLRDEGQEMGKWGSGQRWGSGTLLLCTLGRIGAPCS